MTKEQQKQMELAEAALEKQYGAGVIQNLGNKVNKPIPSIPTNLPSLDKYVLGCGGFPRGRIIEIFGPESSGKTTIALHLIGQCQKMGGVATFVDAEHALSPTHAHNMGVNMDDLIVSQPDYGEQALEVVEALVDYKASDLIVVDSVTALVPKAEIDGEMGDSHMGLQARLMSQAMRKLCGKAATNGILIVFINQIREKVGLVFGNPEVTTGGRALKFYSSVRLEVRKVSGPEGAIKDDKGLIIGHRMKIKGAKNKVGNPFRETIVDLEYESGFDMNADLIEYAIKIGVVQKAGAWCSFDGQKYRQDDLVDVFDKIKAAMGAV